MKKLKYKIYRLKWFLSKWIIFKYPLNVDLELSSICNLKCVFCPQSGQVDFKKQHMSSSIFTKVIDEIEGKVPCIKLNLRGESTLHPHFIEFMDYIKGKFLDIRLNTNGNYPSSLNQVLNAVCKEVSFSLDALLEETYTSIRKGGRFSLIEKNILQLYTMLGTGNLETLVLSFTVTDKNRNELDAFKNYYKTKYPKIKFAIRPVWDRTTTKGVAQFNRKNCYMPNRRLVVLSDGQIEPCCVSSWQKPNINIAHIKLISVLGSWKCLHTQWLRKGLKKNKFSFLPSQCQNCNSSESYDLRSKK